MKDTAQTFVIFLAVDWGLFNRREMIRALARTVAQTGGKVIAVNRPLCPFTTFAKKPGRFKELWQPPKTDLLDSNLILFSPKYFLHDHLAGEFGFLENINIKMLRKSFKQLLDTQGIDGQNLVVWYYYPQQSYVTRIFDNCFSIFELYDELADIHGREIAKLTELEKKYRDRVDLFLTVTNHLFDKYAVNYDEAYLFGNGLSETTYKSLTTAARSKSSSGRPVIGYAGMVSDRLDWNLIREMARLKPEWDFEIHGLISDMAIPAKMKQFDNISFPGPYNQKQLPSILSRFDLALLPYLNNEFFNYLMPLKFFEYSAVGLPIVSTKSYELGDIPPQLLYMPEHTIKNWIEAIEKGLSSDRDELKAIGGRIAKEYVWEDMCVRLLDRISESYSKKTNR